jgi:hypothetical protein
LRVETVEIEFGEHFWTGGFVENNEPLFFTMKYLQGNIGAGRSKHEGKGVPVKGLIYLPFPLSPFY